MAKESISIERAKAQLEQAISESQKSVVENLSSVRMELESLLELAGKGSMNEQVISEVAKLVRVVGGKPSRMFSGSGSAYKVSTASKVEFIADYLKQHDGRSAKTDIFEHAKDKFGSRIAASFLDPAIKSGPFKKEPIGNRVFIELIGS